MNTMIKTTLAIATMGLLFTGCSVEDAITENTSNGGGSKDDSFSITKTAGGFEINWHKGYQGYAEIIYKDASNDKPRGNGYPFTNNATGNYTLSCKKRSEDAREVSYGCSRPDMTSIATVRLVKGTEYQWLVSYGTGHEHGEVEATMEYSEGILIIE